jgi:Zn-finger nucleic acid-binding protein
LAARGFSIIMAAGIRQETMQAETMNCPMCGAAQATDATKCDHCGARLATVACPSCFGLIFQGAKFCSHCGAKVARTEVATSAPRPCPHCRINLEAVQVGSTSLLECSKCEGIWVDTATLQEICADREKQAAVLGLPVPLTDTGSMDYEKVHYYPCPQCNGLMNRVNFANCSHIILDVCGKHGTWFDKDELRKMVEFIRAGGLDKSRAMEIEKLQRERSLANIAGTTGTGNLAMSDDSSRTDGLSRYDGYDLAFDALGAAFRTIFKL